MVELSICNFNSDNILRRFGLVTHDHSAERVAQNSIVKPHHLPLLLADGESMQIPQCMSNNILTSGNFYVVRSSAFVPGVQTASLPVASRLRSE
jgi:hypothetical protein